MKVGVFSYHLNLSAPKTPIKYSFFHTAIIINLRWFTTFFAALQSTNYRRKVPSNYLVFGIWYFENRQANTFRCVACYLLISLHLPSYSGHWLNIIDDYWLDSKNHPGHVAVPTAVNGYLVVGK